MKKRRKRHESGFVRDIVETTTINKQVQRAESELDSDIAIARSKAKAQECKANMQEAKFFEIDANTAENLMKKRGLDKDQREQRMAAKIDKWLYDHGWGEVEVVVTKAPKTK